ncbi:MAG: DUF3048 domain-containing protein [Brevefilum sp.]
MIKKNFTLICLFVLLSMLLYSCQSILPERQENDLKAGETEQLASPTTSNPSATEEPTPTEGPNTPTPEATAEPTNSESEDLSQDPTPEAEVEAGETPASENPETAGPKNFPEGINPLTGLPAEDPDLLELPPALVSISNFPSSARPQAGLNSSPITFEMAVGQGMTRFLAMFYGQFPQIVSGQTEGASASEGSTNDSSDKNDKNQSTNSNEAIGEAASIGPIRSGRLPYEDLRSLYTGFLVMASAWEGITTDLNESTSVFGNDSENINSALVGVEQLRQIAQAQTEEYPGSDFDLEGLMFSLKPPEKGQTAHRLWVFYSMLNQIQWRYNEELGAYIRYDIKTDGSGEFVLSTDRLTGNPVSKENVIVIYAEHDYRAPTLVDINLVNRPPTRALLFRDQEVHEIFWTTKFGEYEQETGLMRPMRFVDGDGNPIPLKPGQTWIHIVSLTSYHRESAISDQPFHPIIEEPGSGLWLVRYKGTY